MALKPPSVRTLLPGLHLLETEVEDFDVRAAVLVGTERAVVWDTLAHPSQMEGVAGLLAAGRAAICRKVGEEATEVITAALGGEGARRVVEEVADLWFHTLVLLGECGIPFREVLEMVERGEIKDSMTVIAVLHAARLRGR